MLAAEAGQGRGGCVTDHRLRDEGHPETPLDPAVAELTVLGDAQLRVESPEHPEAIGGQGQVVGGEETCPARQAVALVRVGEVQDQSASPGVRIGGRHRNGPTAKRVTRHRRVASGQRPQPAGLGLRVVVGERDQLAVRSGGALVARRRPARERPLESAELEAVTVLGGHPAELRVPAVLDHDHLEALRRIVLRGEALEAGGQALRAVPGRDHHRTGWSCVPDCLTRRSRTRT